jgi:uncharacterized protein (DUF427 family)
MPKAIWKGEVIAESDDVKVVEGNYYFPPEAVKKEFLRESDTTTLCPWKGIASYYTIAVGGDTNQDAAWFYPTPKQAAEYIRNYIAFWRGVEVQA